MTAKQIIRSEKRHLKTLIKRYTEIRAQKEISAEDLRDLQILEININTTYSVINYYQSKIKK